MHSLLQVLSLHSRLQGLNDGGGIFVNREGPVHDDSKGPRIYRIKESFFDGLGALLLDGRHGDGIHVRSDGVNLDETILDPNSAPDELHAIAKAGKENAGRGFLGRGQHHDVATTLICLASGDAGEGAGGGTDRRQDGGSGGTCQSNMQQAVIGVGCGDTCGGGGGCAQGSALTAELRRLPHRGGRSQGESSLRNHHLECAVG